MRWLAAALLAALLLLQYRLWISSDGVRAVVRLKQDVATQQMQNAQLTERNRELAAEVRDLKQGYAALEERARSDLGMIAGNETFYQVVPPTAPSRSTVAAATTTTRAATVARAATAATVHAPAVRRAP